MGYKDERTIRIVFAARSTPIIAFSLSSLLPGVEIEKAPNLPESTSLLGEGLMSGFTFQFLIFAFEVKERWLFEALSLSLPKDMLDSKPRMYGTALIMSSYCKTSPLSTSGRGTLPKRKKMASLDNSFHVKDEVKPSD